MNKLKQDRVRMIRPATAMRAAVIALVGMFGPLTGCTGADSHSGDATRAANTGDSLVASARTKCPGATAAIADAEAASRAARAASDAVIAAGKALDAADKDYETYSRDADRANEVRSEKQATAKKMRDQYEAADAAWLAANEEVESAQVQAAAAGIDTSDVNTNGALDKMKAGAVDLPAALVKVALAKQKRQQLDAAHQANKAKFNQIKALEADAQAQADAAVRAQNYRDKKKAAADAARDRYHAAIDDSTAKTNASRAANSRLAAACPEAESDVYPQDARLPGSQPPGLDIFRNTTSHGQEPPSGGGDHHHED